MEFVPMYFCETVCAFLKNLGDLEILCRDKPDCDFWNAAIEKDFKKRPTFKLQVSYAHNKWAYSISGVTDIELFDELTAACKNEYFRLNEISFSTIAHDDQFVSNLEAINEIISSTASYIYKADLQILDGDRNLPSELFAIVADVYKTRSFRKIGFNSQMHLFEDFLTVQLKSEHLKEFHLSDTCSSVLRQQIEEFALTETFHTLELTCVEFDLEFFKKLLKKPLVGVKESFFRAQLNITRHLKDLRELEEESLFSLSSFEASWRTTDGVSVHVSYKNGCLIEVSQRQG